MTSTVKGTPHEHSKALKAQERKFLAHIHMDRNGEEDLDEKDSSRSASRFSCGLRKRYMICTSSIFLRPTVRTPAAYSSNSSFALYREEGHSHADSYSRLVETSDPFDVSHTHAPLLYVGLKSRNLSIPRGRPPDQVVLSQTRL